MKGIKSYKGQGLSVLSDVGKPIENDLDKSKENRIINENCFLVKLPKEVIKMGKVDKSMLNSVYRDIGDKLGVEVATEIYYMFKGQQITFPTRFFSPKKVHELIVKEYDGTNIKELAAKYGYSEKTIRRITKKETKELVLLYSHTTKGDSSK